MIEDTSQRDPALHLLGGLDDFSSYVTGMERAGQNQLVRSDRLPTSSSNTDAEYEALGFTLGEPDPQDPMFRPATLPTGWAREGSEHAMWSRLVDERGIGRVGIFYKAAFYDRSAHMTITDVGDALATSYLYGKEPKPVPWEKLTRDEMEQILHSCRVMEQQIEDCPSVYSGYTDRTQTLLAQTHTHLGETGDV